MAPRRHDGQVWRRALSILKDAADLWSSTNATQHAGALAFYTLFSLAPLMIILIAIISAVLGEEAARGEIAARIATMVGPQAATLVEEAVRRSGFGESGIMPALLGIAALLAGATTVFAQLQSSLNEFWGVTSRPTRSSLVVFLKIRVESLGLVLVIGLLLLTSLVISTCIAAALEYADGWIPVPAPVVMMLDVLVSLLGATLLFAMIFKILPDVNLAWRDMWLGALVTALLFVVGRAGISLYLTHTAPGSTYGAAGALVVLLLWVYYSSLIIFFGAAITRAAIRHRGERIVPKLTAVCVRREVVEQ